MTNRIEYLAFILVAISLSFAAATPRVQATEAPDISSSLAKNLWRQAHFYFEEGMDAKAIRACEELRAWARENNEPAIEQEMAEMLAELRARQPAPAAPVSTPVQSTTAFQAKLPNCGYDSINDIPPSLVTRLVTSRTPAEFQACQQDQDCTLVHGFCGGSRAVNNASKACYEGLAVRFQEVLNCPSSEPVAVSSACKSQVCVLQFY